MGQEEGQLEDKGGKMEEEMGEGGDERRKSGRAAIFQLLVHIACNIATSVYIHMYSHLIL